MDTISTDNAPAAIGPYSQAIRANGLLFASGQIPVGPDPRRSRHRQDPRRHRRPGRAVLPQLRRPPRRRRPRLLQGRQDHLLPRRHRRLRRLQRSLRQILHLQARPLLRRRPRHPQGLPLRDRNPRPRRLTSPSSLLGRAPRGLFCVSTKTQWGASGAPENGEQRTERAGAKRQTFHGHRTPLRGDG